MHACTLLHGKNTSLSMHNFYRVSWNLSDVACPWGKTWWRGTLSHDSASWKWVRRYLQKAMFASTWETRWVESTKPGQSRVAVTFRRAHKVVLLWRVSRFYIFQVRLCRWLCTGLCPHQRFSRLDVMLHSTENTCREELQFVSHVQSPSQNICSTYGLLCKYTVCLETRLYVPS